MLNRRSFLKHTGVAAAGSLVFSRAAAGLAFPPALPEPGLQLFTFFREIDNDVPGTLQKIAAAGYKNIESAFSRKGGFYGEPAKAFGARLRDLGLSWKSHHVVGAPFRRPANAAPPTGPDGKPITIPPMLNLRDNYQQVVDEAAEGGVPYLVCASTPIGTLEEVKASIAVLNRTAEAARKAGIGFAYHNHDAEFRSVEGVVPYDLFLSETDPALLKMELDVAWAVKGGTDPVALFQKHPGRFPLWHLKDLDTEHKTILPVGKGTIDYKRVFAAAATAGLQYYFVEHDMPADAMASITESIAHLKTMLK
ncbi:MAG TPA: sugar phosphate isomerase/epimerase [Chitinophagaceae bacterium]|jgi:sugar phosphate isomerase/epimerase|nr:sugar phosphate isomerase/epimerase [Chitinophagaceae bacterium]